MHTLQQSKALIAAYPAFVSGDDDITTEAGIVQTAAMVVDRIEDEIESSNYSILQSDLKGYYFEHGDYASCDRPSREDAILAAHKDLMMNDEERAETRI